LVVALGHARARPPWSMQTLRAPQFLDRARQLRRDISRQHPSIPQLAADELGGEAVEVDAKGGGVERLETLGNEAGDRAGEDVARAAGSEARVREGAEAC